MVWIVVAMGYVLVGVLTCAWIYALGFRGLAWFSWPALGLLWPVAVGLRAWDEAASWMSIKAIEREHKKRKEQTDE